jgi:hypothetical protein
MVGQIAETEYTDPTDDACVLKISDVNLHGFSLSASDAHKLRLKGYTLIPDDLRTDRPKNTISAETKCEEKSGSKSCRVEVVSWFVSANFTATNSAIGRTLSEALEKMPICRVEEVRH